MKTDHCGLEESQNCPLISRDDRARDPGAFNIERTVQNIPAVRLARQLKSRDGASTKQRRCSVCGGKLPKGTTYLESVQLESEQAGRKWRLFCEACLAKVTEPYETRWDWEVAGSLHVEVPKIRARGG